MSIDVAALARVEAPEARRAVAAVLVEGYKKNRIPFRIAHSVLREYGVPSDAITQGLHTVTDHQLPHAIQVWLNV